MWQLAAADLSVDAEEEGEEEEVCANFFSSACFVVSSAIVDESIIGNCSSADDCWSYFFENKEEYSLH